MTTPREERLARKKINRVYEAAARSPENEGVVWPYKERLYDPAEDEGFLFKNWINPLSNTRPFRNMQFSLFAERQREVIKGVLGRVRVMTKLAVQEDCGEPKFGWICYEWKKPVFVLHFIYVRQHYRNKKIASRLLQTAGVILGETPVVCTSWTSSINYHATAWNLDYDPFLAWGDADAHHKYQRESDDSQHKQPQPPQEAGHRPAGG